MQTLTDSKLFENPQRDSRTSLLKSNSYETDPVVNVPRDPLWSNIKYGSGMLAFIVIPPLLPGVTTRIIIIGYMCVIVSIYTAAGIMAAIRIRHPTSKHIRGRNNNR